MNSPGTSLSINEYWELIRNYSIMIGYRNDEHLGRVADSANPITYAVFPEAFGLFIVKLAVQTLEKQRQWRYLLHPPYGTVIKPGMIVKPGVPRAIAIEPFKPVQLRDLVFPVNARYTVRSVSPILIGEKENGQYSFDTTDGENFLVDWGIFTIAQ